MFCKNCGKELQETNNECCFCGTKIDKEKPLSADTISVNSNFDIASFFKNKTSRFLKFLCLISSGLAFWLRFYFNEIETRYTFLTQDDYYTMGEKGISYIIVLAIVHFALCVFAIKNHNRSNPDTKKKFLWAFFPIALCALMTITIPAPY